MSKAKRKYKAIQTMEHGLAAYFTINAILDEFKEGEAPNIILAKFVARATLNELLTVYLEKNTEQQLESFIERLNKGLELHVQDNQETVGNSQSGNDGASV